MMLQQGRLAAARRTDDRDELAVADIEADAADDREVAEALGDAVDDDLLYRT
jgi:hypothetical protein